MEGGLPRNPGALALTQNSCDFQSVALGLRAHAHKRALETRASGRLPPLHRPARFCLRHNELRQSAGPGHVPASHSAEGPRSRWGARPGPSLAVAGKNLAGKGRPSAPDTLTWAAALPAAAGCALRPPPAGPARARPWTDSRRPRWRPTSLLLCSDLLHATQASFSSQLRASGDASAPLRPQSGHSARSAQAVS